MNKRIFSTFTLITVAAIFGLSYGLAAPLIAVDLSRRGFSEFLIGLNAAMYALGVLLVAPFLSNLSAALGPRRLVVAALAGSAFLLVLFPLFPNVWLWFLFRMSLGVVCEILFVLTESWTNELSDDLFRGRIMAIYTGALSLGFAGGPAILSVFGAGKTAFLTGAAIAACPIIFMIGPWLESPPAIVESPVKPLAYLRLAPLSIAATFLNGAVETAGLSFLVLYATRMGWSETSGMRLVSTLLVGAIVMQLPIGWIADRVNRKRWAIILTVLCTLGALAWPRMLGNIPLSFAMIFIWGGLFVGIYTVMLTLVGSRFSGGELIGIYAVMSVAWGLGALAGPATVGWAMEKSPVYGLPYAVAFGCMLLAAFMMFNRRES
jgi:MFS family permease